MTDDERFKKIATGDKGCDVYDRNFLIHMIWERDARIAKLEAALQQIEPCDCCDCRAIVKRGLL